MNNIQQLLSRGPWRCLAPAAMCRARMCSPAIIRRSVSTGGEFDDKPIRFSGSDADRKASETFIVNSNAPSYQPVCVTLSLVIFMLYFFVFREENDVDEFLGSNFYKHLDVETEISKLQKQLNRQRKGGKDTTKTEAKLLEYQLMKQGKVDQGPLEATFERIEASKNSKNL